MSSTKEDLENELRELEHKAKKLKAKGVDGYENLIERLHMERDNLRDKVDGDYKKIRRHVRSNPEEGILAGLLGGLAVGIILGRLFKS